MGGAFHYGTQKGQTTGDTVGRYSNHADDPKPDTSMRDKFASAMDRAASTTATEDGLIKAPATPDKIEPGL